MIASEKTLNWYSKGWVFEQRVRGEGNKNRNERQSNKTNKGKAGKEEANRMSMDTTNGAHGRNYGKKTKIRAVYLNVPSI